MKRYIKPIIEAISVKTRHMFAASGDTKNDVIITNDEFDGVFNSRESEGFIGDIKSPSLWED